MQLVDPEEMESGDAKYRLSYRPKILGFRIRFTSLSTYLGLQTLKVDEMLNHFVQGGLQFIGGGNEDRRYLKPFWGAPESNNPQVHNIRSSSSSQSQHVHDPANMPPFWDALDLAKVPTYGHNISGNQLNHFEDFADLIPACTRRHLFCMIVRMTSFKPTLAPALLLLLIHLLGSESPTQPYHYNPRICPALPSFGIECGFTPSSSKGLKRKLEDDNSPHIHHYHQDDDHEIREDDHSNDVDGASMHHHYNHDEERSPSITSSYIGSVQNFLVQQGPLPWMGV